MTVAGAVHVSHPFQQYPRLCFARAAARSESFAGSAAGASAPPEPARARDDLLIGAASGTVEADVRIRARGELVERMSNVVAGRQWEGDQTGETSYARLTARGAPAVDPRAWPELAEVADIAERPMVWTSGVSLTSGAEVLVPACTAYLRHRPPSGAPPLMSPGSAGLSAHRDTELARRHGLLEVLERDLFWRTWYDLAPATVLADTPMPELTLLDLDRTALLLAGPGGTACVAVCLADRSGRRQSFGARAVDAVDGPRLAAATEVATHEALMVRWSLRTPSALAAWRALADSAADADSAGALPTGPLEHALHTYHRQDSLGHLLSHAAAPGTPAPRTGTAPRTRTDPPTGAGRADLAGLLADHTGRDVVWVDTTIPSIRIDSDGGTVVGRVIAPGARRLPGSERRLPRGLRTRTRLPHPLG